MKITPEELFKQAAGGDQAAWRSVYEMFCAPVYQFFLKNTSNRELADDKVQEVFIKIYRSRKSFSYGSLKAWIFRICRNTLIDTYRQKNTKEVLSETLPDITSSETRVEDEVISAIENSQMAQMIDECLDRMNLDERMIICLVYIANLSISQLAELMELPLGTAKTKVRKARLILDAMLKESLQTKKIER